MTGSSDFKETRDVFNELSAKVSAIEMKIKDEPSKTERMTVKIDNLVVKVDRVDRYVHEQTKYLEDLKNAEDEEFKKIEAEAELYR